MNNARTFPQFKLRLPPGLLSRAKVAAKTSRRSLNAELVLRLQESFDWEVLVDARQSISAPATPRRLRLLCVLCRKDGTPIVQPVAVSRLPAPWAPLQGKWPVALPPPFFLRETRPTPPTDTVLARCLRQRQADALRADPRALRS